MHQGPLVNRPQFMLTIPCSSLLHRLREIPRLVKHYSVLRFNTSLCLRQKKTRSAQLWLLPWLNWLVDLRGSFMAVVVFYD